MHTHSIPPGFLSLPRFFKREALIPFYAWRAVASVKVDRISHIKHPTSDI